MRQTGFSFLKDYKKEFGGSLLIGKRKVRRPLSAKKPIHLVLRAGDHRIFAPGDKFLTKLVREECQRFGIKLYDFALNWTHVHAVIQIPNREAYVKMIRALTSKIVAHVSEVMRWKFAGLFTLRPFTKILEWGRQFKNALEYQVLNQIEAKQGKAERKRVEKERRRRS